jgi:hypothetical protein
MMKPSTASALAMAAMFAGVAIPGPRPVDASSRCPSCRRGKLQGRTGYRYCQRCAWIEAGEKERGEAILAEFGGGK